MANPAQLSYDLPQAEMDSRVKAYCEERDAEKVLAAHGLRIGLCRDIVGNTICADILDYLHRDWFHTGKPRHFEDRILHYMEIRTPRQNAPVNPGDEPKPTAEDTFVVSIGNRPKLRTDGISAI